MKRQDLIAIAQDRRRVRELLLMLAFCLAWLLGLFSKADYLLDQDVELFMVLAAVPIVVMVAFTAKQILSLPKCPHCGIRLVGWLLGTAVASGKCPSCGKSIED